MTQAQRLALGLAIGALATLLIHPRSRPLLLTCFIRLGQSSAVQNSAYIPESLEVLPVPKSLLDYSLWMQVGGKRIIPPKRLTKDQVAVLAQVADVASEAEPDNAYWRQMAAVFYWEQLKKKEAIDRWKRASHAARWDDHQSYRLTKVVEGLASESGGEAAWQYARAYSLRSTSPALAIELFSRSLLNGASLDTREGLELRMATLRNGRLLREGSRSIEAGNSGVSLVAYSCYPRITVETPSPKMITIARFAFIDALRMHGMVEEGEEANRAYLSNEGWLALSDKIQAREEYKTLATYSVVTATFPSALIIIALIGLVIIGYGEALRKSKWLQMTLKTPYAQAIGVVLAVALYALTAMPLVALTAALCFGFLTFEPGQWRTRPPEYLGPLFRFTVVMLAVVFIVLTGAFWIGLSTPAREVLPAIDAPIELYGGQALPLGLAGIMLALLLLVGPSWALVLRLPTPYVVIAAIREFGWITFFLPVALAVVSVPLSLYVDTRIGESLHKLMVDEPNYYLIQ